MKIAELEAHHNAYNDSERVIQAMVDKREFPKVFSVCTASLPHIVPAITFRKKRGIMPETPDLSAFATICNYAPPLFEHSAIELLLDFTKSARILADSDKRFLHSIEAAQKRERLAQRIWSHLERHPGVLEREICTELGIVQEGVANIVEIWERFGILDRTPDGRSYRLCFHTRLDMEAVGVCPNCGVRGKAHKELFFRSLKCHKCDAVGHYHIEYGGIS